jgi:hypothetical protein
MFGMFSLLPLLKGWQYRKHGLARTLANGEVLQPPWRIPEMGWLLSIYGFTTDAYGTVRLEYQDADLQTSGGESYPEAYRIVGAVVQDPNGWVSRYLRPNPLSTAGLYETVVFSAGFQGSAFPFIPTTIVTLRLPPESTQASALVGVEALAVAITNRKTFIQSLRQLLNSHANIELPKELLSLGPVELVQQPNKTDELLEQILTELKQR